MNDGILRSLVQIRLEGIFFLYCFQLKFWKCKQDTLNFECCSPAVSYLSRRRRRRRRRRRMRRRQIRVVCFYSNILCIYFLANKATVVVVVVVVVVYWVYL